MYENKTCPYCGCEGCHADWCQDYKEPKNLLEDTIKEKIICAQFGSKDQSDFIESYMREYFKRWHNYKDRLTNLEWYHLFLDFYEAVEENFPKPHPVCMCSQYREVIKRFLAEPYGCPFCDSGKLRSPDNPKKGHDDDCPYFMANRVLNSDNNIAVSDTTNDAM